MLHEWEIVDLPEVYSVFYFFSHSLSTFKSHVVFLVKLIMSEGMEEWMCTKFCEKMRKMMTKLTDVSTVWRSDNEVSGSDISHRGTMNVRNVVMHDEMMLFPDHPVKMRKRWLKCMT